jgi:hypothetical protein
VLQLFLIIWGFKKPTSTRAAVTDPPAYIESHVDKINKEQKEKDLSDWQSVSSRESGDQEKKEFTTKV